MRKIHSTGLAVLLTAALVATGCGTRRSNESLRSAAGASTTTSATSAGASPPEASTAPERGSVQAPAEAAPGATPSATSPKAAPAAAAPAAQSASSALRSSAGAASKPAGNDRSGAGVGAAPGSGGAAAGPAGSSGVSGAPAGGAAPVPPAVTKAGSPMAIGNVGTYTGPAGSSLKDLRDGVQVWAQWVNDHGGVNGHPVKMIVADDGGDQSRYRSLIQQMVETQGVIAFVANAAPFTGGSTVEYTTKKGIPVIGNEGGSDWFYSSPTYFTPVPTGVTYWHAYPFSVIEALDFLGQGAKKAKWGSLTCTEAGTCGDGDHVWHDEGGAKAAGLTPVYRGRASLAQPDFTAECLAARNAGVEVLSMIMDAASFSRIGASCARQGYHPIFTGQAASVKTDMATDPNLSGNAFVGVLGHFIWTSTATPAMAEFQAAMKKFLGRTPSVGHATAWVAGKLFEEGAIHLSEPPTPQSVLDGLYTIRNDDLGGLTMPLTFTRGQPAPRQVCWATSVTKDGKWVPLHDGKVLCH